jgi:rSAM/selenodomain-associated transferase 2
VLTSVIIPALNEEARIEGVIRCISQLGGDHEIIVADGGSSDATVARAEAAGAKVLRCPRGRGAQMHTGALASRGDVLWFVHADTDPCRQSLAAIAGALADPTVLAGNFALRFAGNSRAAQQMTWIYPKLRLFGLSYGDAGIFVRRSAYEGVGGFRDYALFEDLDLVRRLKRAGRFVHLNEPITTSSRRFERRYAGAWMNWIALQLLYWAGVSPNVLARWYRFAR